MQISVAEAEGQLTELVKLANQGEEVVLTQDGQPSIRLEPIGKRASPEEKVKLLDRLQSEIRQKHLPSGPEAARSQDFLYDEYGLPK